MPNPARKRRYPVYSERSRYRNSDWADQRREACSLVGSCLSCDWSSLARGHRTRCPTMSAGSDCRRCDKERKNARCDAVVYAFHEHVPSWIAGCAPHFAQRHNRCTKKTPECADCSALRVGMTSSGTGYSPGTSSVHGRFIEASEGATECEVQHEKDNENRIGYLRNPGSRCGQRSGAGARIHRNRVGFSRLLRRVPRLLRLSRL